MVSKVAERSPPGHTPHKPLFNELMGLEQGPPVLAQQVPGDPQGGHPAQQKAEQADYSLPNDSFRVALHGVSSLLAPAGGCRKQAAAAAAALPDGLSLFPVSIRQHCGHQESTRDRHRTTATTAAMRFAGAWGPGALGLCLLMAVPRLLDCVIPSGTSEWPSPNRRRR